MRRHVSRRTEDAGLPRFGRRLPVMIAVIEQPGITVNELARTLRMAKSQVSGIVSSLGSQGVLEKRGDPEDQRLTRLYPTEAGVRQAREWREIFRSALADAVHGMTEDEADRLIEGLRALLRVMSADRE